MYSCNRDYLAVYDGENDQARRLGSFCGNVSGMRAFKTLYSSGRHLYLKFKSDGKNQKKGFHLEYQTFLKGKSSNRHAYSMCNKVYKLMPVVGCCLKWQLHVPIVCPSSLSQSAMVCKMDRNVSLASCSLVLCFRM